MPMPRLPISLPANIRDVAIVGDLSIDAIAATITKTSQRHTSRTSREESLNDPHSAEAELTVIPVRAIKLALEHSTEEEVLAVLAAKDSPMATRVTASVARVALVSYRQEPGPEGTQFANFTIDDVALRGVLEQADALGCDSLWCDAWCYRFTGSYDHADFCSTLHNSVRGIRAVVWLPRSKNCSGSGEYAYRLW